MNKHVKLKTQLFTECYLRILGGLGRGNIDMIVDSDLRRFLEGEDEQTCQLRTQKCNECYLRTLGSLHRGNIDINLTYIGNISYRSRIRY